MTAVPVSADGHVWNEALTRAAIKGGRSFGRCEWHGDHPATDMHHRRNASQGGRWHPANVVHICRPLHHEVTVSPGWAHSVGLTLWTGEDPSETPLLISGRAVFLTDQLIAVAGRNAR